MRADRGMLVAAALVVAVLLRSGGAPVGDEDSFYGRLKAEAAGRALYSRMLRTIRDARTLSLESDYVWQTDSLQIGHATYRLWMAKPNLARLESWSADGAHRGIIVLDGRELWIYWPTGRPPIPGADTTQCEGTGMTSFLRKNGARGTHSLAHETWSLGTGMSMTILEPSVFHGSTDPLDRYFNGARLLGSATVGQEQCDIVEATFLGGERTRTFWISKRDRLPRMLEEVVRTKRRIVTRERWSKVSIGAEIPRDLFTWRPPASWVELRMPALEDGLLKPGAEAPDFEAPLVDGTTFRLSENRGKVVWLCFWRIACPPCREELPHLDKLSARYAGDDLVIVGFNFADERAAAKAFLRERSVTLPSVIDNSPAAQEIYYRRYQTVKGMSAVPLNYIIDEEGKVVDGWYGYQKGEERGLKIIRGLGAVPQGARRGRDSRPAGSSGLPR
jgi:peroxiredoxin/outer membrane lipoprotein-sorting protein